MQGGKTLVGWVIPILFHIFERKENFGAGVPTGEQAGDKWKLELLPAIDASPKFRALKPVHGKGSKGGKFEAAEFKHGPTLKFLSGHGGDEKRSSITLRGSAVTEADRLDTAGEASREAAPIFQIEGRSASFEDEAVFYAECTSTIKTGFVTREREAGSCSSIVCPCPHCGEYVCPERKHLVGWQHAENEIDARKQAAWICPHCAVILTENERRAMNEAAKVLHRGQEIGRDGVIYGPMPATRTLGFRANAFNNLLWSASYVAGQEWLASRDKDQESAEKKMRQWYWAEAIEPNAIDVTPLELEDVIGRQQEKLTRGIVPAGTFHISGAADIRKTQLHYVVIAWWRDADRKVHGHIVDLGIVPVESGKYGTKAALLRAMRVLRESIVEPGFREANSDRVWRPGWFPIDAYWFGGAVRAFVRESQKLGIKRYIPSFGRGVSAEKGRGRYQHPLEATEKKPHIGEEYYIAWGGKYAMHHAIANADHWKTFVREAFATPEAEAGSLQIFEATTEDELRLVNQFGKQIVAEKAQEIIVPERGVQVVYVNTSARPNHFGDATYNACWAGHLCGVRISEPEPVVMVAAMQPAPAQPLTMPDGRPYFISNRDE